MQSNPNPGQKVQKGSKVGLILGVLCCEALPIKGIPLRGESEHLGSRRNAFRAIMEKAFGYKRQLMTGTGERGKRGLRCAGEATKFEVKPTVWLEIREPGEGGTGKTRKVWWKTELWLLRNRESLAY